MSELRAMVEGMTTKQLLLEGFQDLLGRIFRETGTRPDVTVYIHSTLFDTLVEELSGNPSSAYLGNDEIHITMPAGDVTVRPERARQR